MMMITVLIYTSLHVNKHNKDKTNRSMPINIYIHAYAYAYAIMNGQIKSNTLCKCQKFFIIDNIYSRSNYLQSRQLCKRLIIL